MTKKRNGFKTFPIFAAHYLLSFGQGTKRMRTHAFNQIEFLDTTRRDNNATGPDCSGRLFYRRLQRFIVLFFMELSTRRVEVTGISAIAKWTMDEPDCAESDRLSERTAHRQALPDP